MQNGLELIGQDLDQVEKLAADLRDALPEIQRLRDEVNLIRLSAQTLIIAG
jgi:hypothetical protein